MESIHEAYKELEGSTFISHGKGSFILKYDNKRRCFELFQKKSRRSNVIQEITAPAHGRFKKQKLSFPQSAPYISLDAIALKEILPQLKLVIPRNKRVLIEHLVSLEKNEQDQIQKELGEDFKCETEIWKDKDGRYKMEIEEGVFITSKISFSSLNEREDLQDDEVLENIEAFKNLATQEYYLRRKKRFVLPLVPSHRFEFRLWGKKNDGIGGMAIDGFDDLVAAINTLGLQSKSSYALNALLYPATIPVIKMGEEGITGEAEEVADEIRELNESISRCRRSIKEFNIKLHKKNSITKEDIKQHLQNIRNLKEKLEELKGKPIEAFSGKYFGTTGLRFMISSIVVFQLENMINFFGGINLLTKNGIEAGIVEGITSTEEGIMTTLIGGGFGLIGQIFMTCHAGCKAYSELQEVKKLTTNIKGIEKYESMSLPFKEILLGIQKDKRFYKKATALSFLSLSVGQLLMALGSAFILALEPLALIGLGATLGGVAGSVISEKRFDRRYAFESAPSPLEKKINDYYGNIICSSLVNSLWEKHAAVVQPGIKTSVSTSALAAKKALEEKGYTMEALSFLNMTSLVVNSVFSRGQDSWKNDKDSPASRGIKKSILHYNARGRKAQKPLAELLLGLSAYNKNKIENLFLKCDPDRPLEYMATWKIAVEALEVKPMEAPYLLQLGKLMRKYDKFPLKRKETLFAIQCIKGLPEGIKQEIIKGEKKNFSYRGLALAVQNGYIKSKFAGLVNFNAAQAGKAENFSSVLLNSNYASSFKCAMLKKSYIKDNKWKFWEKSSNKESYKQQDPDSIIHIKGSVIKEGGTGRFHSKKEKNVYALNTNALTCHNTSVVPSVKLITKLFKGEGKYRIRSAYFRSVEAAENVINQKNAFNSFIRQI